MCGLPGPMRGGEGTRFDLRAHPSLAQDVVAGLPDLPSGTAGPRGQSQGTGVKPGPQSGLSGHEVTFDLGTSCPG